MYIAHSGALRLDNPVQVNNFYPTCCDEAKPSWPSGVSSQVGECGSLLTSAR